MECRVASAERSSRLGQAQMTPDWPEQPLHGVRGCRRRWVKTLLRTYDRFAALKAWRTSSCRCSCGALLGFNFRIEPHTSRFVPSIVESITRASWHRSAWTPCQRHMPQLLIALHNTSSARRRKTHGKSRTEQCSRYYLSHALSGYS